MPAKPNALRIWDLPTRLFHLALALCVTGAILAVKLGGNWMDWHLKLGVASLALVVFRILWGLLGPRYARFSQFVVSPLRTLNYLRQPVKTVGHNPLGAWSVLLMLLVLGWQGFSGLFASDDILTQGPLAGLVSNAWVERLTGLHKLNEVTVYVVIGLHLAAILLYTLKKHGLIMPMIHGDVALTALPPNTVATNDGWRTRLLALVLAGLLGLIAWWLVSLV